MFKPTASVLSMLALALLSLSLDAHAQAGAKSAVTAPAQAFWLRAGTDRKLADWNELTAYYKKVAAQSNRVNIRKIG